MKRLTVCVVVVGASGADSTRLAQEAVSTSPDGWNCADVWQAFEEWDDA